ncbi:dihydrofolate reductase [Streptomyces sp. VRA16 Mangrove soil]|uniref:dihydrofolate reductase n=1 Tax=Streptomyces sp. VRA16 Mangrove soil TaxID=2817434 RepID=UPI001A9CC91A|nr:dihydrofolate reductase [Streptomyces sp. VRA16 Mangrove soil]MBO1330763.1 dihydrofolate reductase [Streptomyces sp. VRA16 Mangrove soil]
MSGTAGLGLIWAQTSDGVIGAGNTIPWHLPEDLAHFKATTLGHPVIMGRRTWDSLPTRFRPLPGRRNIVLTRDRAWTADGAERTASVPEALAFVAGPAWVIGGGEIYRAALPHATSLSITEIDTSVDGDTHAPVPGPEWKITQDHGWQTSTTGLRYRIRLHTRA